ncbi:MAG: diaminopimelate decarboxylase [Xanthomonadales bacterium]|jgi:diaminopimelate decarboxylase|nr:diaminopimelate decarboxylase [Xanthomonadales bacterium]
MHPTPANQLDSIRTESDHLAMDAAGELLIEGITAADLLNRFGSPLYVVSEATLRQNVRRIRAAFEERWPKPVNIMYAIKANTNLAVRAILHQEGAGGDCFSEGELFATFEAGADAAKIALNGSLKSDRSLEIAVRKGVTVNVDAANEIARLRGICRSVEKSVKVNIRLKPLNPAYDGIQTDYFGGERLAEYIRRVKWGFSIEGARALVEEIHNHPEFELTGFSSHIGRVSRDPRFFEGYAAALGGMVTRIYTETGFAPQVLDIGGGWPRERDPESRSLTINRTPVESYVQAACDGLLDAFRSASLSVPRLWVEPGRYIVGNASVLLATVGTIKQDLGLTWVNIDAGSNELPRIDTSGSAYHVIAASGMQRPADREVDVVGPICIDSLIQRDAQMPGMEPGEPVAILDAGMYSESASTQFNSIPRPATVLVNGGSAEVIREREQVSDLFRLHRIPERLLSAK